MPINNDKATGSAALTAFLNKHLGAPARVVFNADNGFTKAASEPLEAIAVFSSSAEHPYWTYVTYGLSDLNEKESEDPNLSGYGFELTFRLRARNDELAPPQWPCDLLNNLARTVFQFGSGLKPGFAHVLDGPIETGSTTRITAFTVVEDPELASLKTPNGEVSFLQILGLTPDELDLLTRCNHELFLDAAKRLLGPLLITDLNRVSLLEDFSFKESVNQNSSTNARSRGTISCPSAEWFFMTRATVSLPLSIAGAVKDLLPELLSTGSNLTIQGADCKIIFRPAKKESFAIEDADLILELPVSTAKAFADKLQHVSSTLTFDNIPVSIEFA